MGTFFYLHCFKMKKKILIPLVRIHCILYYTIIIHGIIYAFLRHLRFYIDRMGISTK